MKKPPAPTPAPSGGELILYQTQDGRTRLEVRLQGETAWLSLNQMADLFQRDKSVISRHIKNVFEEGELNAAATVANFATVQSEGKKQVSREIEFYGPPSVGRAKEGFSTCSSVAKKFFASFAAFV